jgi:hypothetical protein
MSMRRCCDICDKHMSEDVDPDEGIIIEQMGQPMADKLEKLIPGFDGTSDDLDICSTCIVGVVEELRKRRGSAIRKVRT